MNNGIVYIVFKKHKGVDHIKEVIQSARAVKNIHKKLNITLFTDSKNINENCFDNIKIIPINNTREKQNYLYDSPYDYTLYLDSDTKVVNPIEDIFKILDRFDIAACFDHARKDPKKSKVWEDYAKIPSSFSEFAGGVILFKKSPVVESFFKVWRVNYGLWKKASGKLNDQPSFRVSLWQCSDLKVYTLPPEYNLRTQEKRDKFIINPVILHWHKMYMNVKGTPQKF
jgi:hypothetical protein